MRLASANDAILCDPSPSGIVSPAGEKDCSRHPNRYHTPAPDPCSVRSQSTKAVRISIRATTWNSILIGHQLSPDTESCLRATRQCPPIGKVPICVDNPFERTKIRVFRSTSLLLQWVNRVDIRWDPALNQGFKSRGQPVVHLHGADRIGERPPACGIVGLSADRRRNTSPRFDV